MNKVAYKGFEITSTSMQLVDTGEWTLSVMITKHHDSRGETLMAPYSCNNTFNTKDEADNASIDFAKKIIHGEVSGVTVNDLL